jgi:hypothetical protein
VRGQRIRVDNISPSPTRRTEFRLRREMSLRMDQAAFLISRKEYELLFWKSASE